ncbi:conserved hypothetical protein [Histoplasma capsulatum G186AR]|uniref:Nucleoporin Nup159/Nup146 N-terminal domain-containing protein n=1 Tax=Ajellomyces capsulatus (strain G186AR / H82 / ATCC MYA-2454 / RMSCC 2432) TaxID=447093 RepID=C0NCT7_AJECG|nr:uncharacterized protein HCBG_00933 [Histoplasma capsulatum G186AR]EEH11478.1 conserved hypothetical protein [Histoplasma capsulatum G186AR]
MAFSSSQPSAAFGGGQASTVQLGPELQEIQTQARCTRDEVGFLSIAGDSKVRLFPTPWPNDSLPPPSCSLLSVASVKGLLAAAGPEGLIIASTDSVRKAYTADATGDSNIRQFQPQLQIPLPQKVSHVAFSADENVLVVAAADGSGLIAYQVVSLMQGNSQPALTIPLNGARLRALAPNPMLAELFAAVTTEGELLMANLQTSQLVQGTSGLVLKTGVSCISWSNRGKQLVAGLGNGTVCQMTPEGEMKAEIPRPPDLIEDKHVSSISWLENHVFFVVYTPTSSSEGQPESTYYIINRQPPDNYTFQKLPEVCPPWGLERNPAYQFIGRLRDFKPELKDALIVSSTASTDIALLTKSSKPLAEEGGVPVTDAFTVTTMSEDSRRAELPLTDDSENTSPIGLAIDLSSKDIVSSPIPGEDIQDSGIPLPNVLVLNNDGVLSSWWFVYSESIRQRVPYHGLVAAGVEQSVQQSQPQQNPLASSMLAPQTPKPFGQSPFGLPSTSPFGSPSGLGANRPSAFGPQPALSSQPSWATQGFGQSQSPSQSAPATSSFVSLTPSFGSPNLLGQRSSAFGQPPLLGKPATASPFGSGFGAFSGSSGGTGTETSKLSTQPFSGSSGGFGSFAAASDSFATVKASQPSGGSIFGKPPVGENPFAKAGQPIFSSVQNTVSSPVPPKTQPSPFGAFNQSSGFKTDTITTMDEDKPEESKGAFSFANMMTFDEPTEKKSVSPKASPPPSLPAISSLLPKPASPEPQTPQNSVPPPTDLFAAPHPSKPPPPAQTKELTSPFGKLPASMAPPKETEKPSLSTPSLPDESSLSESTVKVEHPSDEETPMPKLAEPPLPPDPTSRAAYAPGDTSASSSSVSKVSFEEAPLPPDFIPAKKEGTSNEVAVALPAESDEGESADFEDSGEEVAGDISPVEETDGQHVQSLKTSPESSFGGPAVQSPDSSMFTKVPSLVQQLREPKQLFGEITQPIFPSPKLPDGRIRLAPRSPSPVRRSLLGLSSARDGLRATSAPSAPGRALAQRKVTLESSMLSKQVELPADDEGQTEELSRQAQRLAAESQPLSEDDEDEQLRTDLARPLSPAPTLDPFLPHQDYTGESLKPGIPGQIERLYRDINSMIDTLGINSRSLSSFLLYQHTAKEPNYKHWLTTLQSEHPSDILEDQLLLSEVDKLAAGIKELNSLLQQQQLQKVEETFENCQRLFSKDLVTLRGQCASLRRSIDAHVDTVAIASAPLSAEQATLQQDLRQASTELQSKMANLEKEISILRAKIADSAKPDSDGSSINGSTGRRSMARPTVEAVTSTIATMTNMAEKKRSDIDVLEAQLRKLGIDVSGASGGPAGTGSARSRSREASPFLTPPRGQRGLSRVPVTPGSRGSVDGAVGTRSAYHTPESATRAHVRFRSSLLGSAGKKSSLLHSVSGPGELVLASEEDTQRWMAKTKRRREIVGHVRTVLVDGTRKARVRGMDEI